MSTLEENKRIAAEFLHALGSGNADAVARLMTPDMQAVCTGTSVLSGTRGFADVVAGATMICQLAQAGIRFEILNLTAEADRVACEAQGHATLVNGQPYNNQYHFLMTLRNGQVCAMKEYLDTKLIDTALGPLLQAALGG